MSYGNDIYDGCVQWHKVWMHSIHLIWTNILFIDLSCRFLFFKIKNRFWFVNKIFCFYRSKFIKMLICSFQFFMFKFRENSLTVCHRIQTHPYLWIYYVCYFKQPIKSKNLCCVNIFLNKNGKEARKYERSEWFIWAIGEAKTLHSFVSWSKISKSKCRIFNETSSFGIR